MIRTIGLNILILCGLLGSIEGFFRLNSRYHFIKDIKNDGGDSRPLNFPINPEDIRAEFGNSAFLEVDPFYKYKINPELAFFRPSDADYGGRVQKKTSDNSERSELRIKNNGPLIYGVDYKYTPTWLRQVENRKPKSPNQQFVIAAGCSYTFGEALDQGQDYPSILQKILNEKWVVYNYGQRGGAPNTLLDSLENHPDTYKDVLQENEGIFIWRYMTNHAERFFCPVSCYTKENNEFIHSHAEYILKDGKFVTEGSFENSHFFKRKFIRFLANSKALQFFHFEYPDPRSEEAAEIFMKALDESVRKIESGGKKITKKIFVIDGTWYDFDIISAAAKKHQFDVIDFEKIKNFRSDIQFTIPIDSHPTSEANWMMAEILKDHIK